MAAAKGNQNAKGNRGGRSHPVATIQSFYKKLDALLPDVIQEVKGVIDWANQELEARRLMLENPKDAKTTALFGPKATELQKLKIDAAKVLIAKAPDRVVNAEGGDLFAKLLEKVAGE